MSHTFVTFLGRGQQDRDTGEWVYREATYEFPAASGKPKPQEKTTEFFGLALAEYIKPDRVVILGTSGSQWGVLVNKLASEGELEDERIELLDAEKNQTVNDEMLEVFNEVMQRTVKPNKATVVPLLIPFGKNQQEQYEILGIIAKNVLDGSVSLDLTHGFRHLGMIGFLSAFMLTRIGNLKVRNLWYGALDMTPREGCKKGITPVLKLNGLDRVRSWLNALNRFYASGDYGVFVNLLINDEVSKDKAEHLKKAAFYERTHNLFRAEEEIHKFLPALEEPMQGASALFKDGLRECLAWVNESTAAKKQGKLARQYLERRDYVRAAAFGWESLVTKECERQGEPQLWDRAVRERQDVGRAVQKWEADIKKECQNKGLDPQVYEDRLKVNNQFAESKQWPILDGQRPGTHRAACENLNDIRNVLVHGIPPESPDETDEADETERRARRARVDRVDSMLEEEKQLRKALQDAFKHLLPGK